MTHRISRPLAFALSIGGAAATTVFAPVVEPVLPAVTLATVPALVIGVLDGSMAGVAYGALAGLTLDLLGGGALGVHAGAVALVGYGAAQLSRRLADLPAPIKLLLASPLSFLYVPMTVLLAALAGSRFTWSAPLVIRFVLSNALCALVLLLALLLKPSPELRTR